MRYASAFAHHHLTTFVRVLSVNDMTECAVVASTPTARGSPELAEVLRTDQLT